MIKVFAINGIGMAGKDSFIDRVENMLPLNYAVKRYSTVDPVKELYKTMGWGGVKTPKHRAALNTLKTVWVDLNDGPTNAVISNIEVDAKIYSNPIVFIMVREYLEMLKLVARAEEKGWFVQTIEVVRDGVSICELEDGFLRSHPADYRYNWTILNRTTSNPDIPELWDTARQFIQGISGENAKRYNQLGPQLDLANYGDARSFGGT